MKSLALALALTASAAQADPAAQLTTDPTVWMIVTHEVADYDRWRDVFDGGLTTRQAAGELQYQILVHEGPPQTVIAIFEWNDEQRALTFVNDPFVRNAMVQAGVISEPVVSIHAEDPRYWLRTAVSGPEAFAVATTD